jgi:hypothetical protein
MSDVSDWQENKIINRLMRGDAWTPPTTGYLALMTTLPTDAGGGVEVSGGSYARQAIAFNSSNWTASATGGPVANINAITFPKATALWGTIVGFALYDASSGGNLLWFKAMTNESVPAGNTKFFAAGNLSFALSGDFSDYLRSGLLNLLFRGDAFTFPTNFYFALMNTNAISSGGGAEVSTSGTAYARQVVPQGTGDWTLATAGVSGNVAVIAWSLATGSGWGSVQGIAVYDAGSGGNLLFFKSWSSQTIAVPNTIEIDAGAFTVAQL